MLQVFATGPYHHQLQIWVPFENVVEDVAEAPGGDRLAVNAGSILTSAIAPSHCICILSLARMYYVGILAAWTTAAPILAPTLPLHTPHLCMFLGFRCGREGEISPNIQVVVVCLCFGQLFFSRQPLSLHKINNVQGLLDDSPPVLCHLSYDSRLS